MLNRILDAVSIVITWTLLLAVLGGGAFAVYVYNRADDQIRTYVENTLAAHYAPLQVQLDSARILERRGIELRGLSIRDANRSAEPLVHLESIVIACEPTIDDLACGKLRIRHVTISHPKIRIGCDDRGDWHLGKLLVPPEFCGASKPTIQVINGVVQIADARRNSNYTLRDIALTIQQRIQATPLSTLATQTAGPATGNVADAEPTNHSPLSNGASHGIVFPVSPQPPEYFQLSASFTGDHLQHTSISGVIQPPSVPGRGDGRWRFKGDVPRLELSPEFRSSLPQEVAQYLKYFATLRSGGRFQFDVSHRPERVPALQYEIDGQLSDGRVDDPRFTFPLTDLQATLHVSHEGFLARQISGRYGEANLNVACQGKWHAPGGALAVQGSVERLRIDQNLASTLPLAAQQTWQKFEPDGLIDAKFQMSFDGVRWHARHVAVACREMSILAQAFPYPLRDVKGQLRWHEEHASFDLRASASGQPVLVRGEIDSPGENWTGWVTGRTDGRIALDETLVAALRPEVQEIVSKFGARGWLTAHTEFRRDTPTSPLNKQITVDVFDTYVRHEKFPYPLQEVRGRLQMANDAWQIQDFQGHNDTAKITCEGSITPHPDGNILRLSLAASNLPLDDELRLSLPAKSQGLWNQLRPNGQLDFVAASIEKVGHNDPDVSVTVQKKPTPRTSVAPSLSIHPIPFPYRVDQLTGIAQFKNGVLKFERLRGEHGRTGVHIASGSGTATPNGEWQLQLHNLSLDQLSVDHDLLAAVPARLNRQLVQSRVDGFFSLQGSLAFAGNRRKPQNIRSKWDLAIDLDDANIYAGTNAEHISGTLRLNGGSNLSEFYSQGFLEIDSMVLKDVHVTQARGPIWIDPNRVLFGRWARPKGSPEPPTQITARVFGGEVSCDGQMRVADQGQFQVQLQLKDAITHQLVKSARRQQGATGTFNSTTALAPKIEGRTSANVALSGSRQGRHTLQGTGVARLTDANLYELPFILSLFRTLRSGSVDRTAFDESDVQFRIQGDHVTFDKLDLLGDGIALKGVGEMSGRQEVNLDFYTIIGKRNAYLNSIRPVLGIASNRFLQIHVEGPINDPTMTREVLPGLNDTLRQLFPEVEVTADTRSTQDARIHPGGRTSTR